MNSNVCGKLKRILCLEVRKGKPTYWITYDIGNADFQFSSPPRSVSGDIPCFSKHFMLWFCKPKYVLFVLGSSCQRAKLWNKSQCKKTNQQKKKPNPKQNPKPNNLRYWDMDVLFHFFPDTFSADYLYMLVCLISSDHETRVEAEDTSFCIVVSGYNLTR